MNASSLKFVCIIVLPFPVKHCKNVFYLVLFFADLFFIPTLITTLSFSILFVVLHVLKCCVEMSLNINVVTFQYYSVSICFIK